jgi:hypothetical protein
MQRAARSLQQFSLPRGPDDRTKSFLSIVTGLSGHEGEAVVYGQARMLHDSTGRVCKLQYELTSDTDYYSVHWRLGNSVISTSDENAVGTALRAMRVYR